MLSLKVHPQKHLLKLLEGHSRLLILGPLEIDSSLLQKSIKETKPDLILFIDGGFIHRNSLTKNQLKISLSVGDGDSLPTLQKKELDILLPSKKNFSDLAFVLRALKKSKTPIEKLTFLGFSSMKKEKRIDHLLFNLGEIQKITSAMAIAIRLDETFLFFPPGKHSFRIRGLFSLVTFSRTALKISGSCEYELLKWTHINAFSSLGLSNKGHGLIHLETNKAVLIYLAGSSFSS